MGNRHFEEQGVFTIIFPVYIIVVGRAGGGDGMENIPYFVLTPTSVVAQCSSQLNHIYALYRDRY